MMDRCKQYLLSGVPVAVFPEGGRAEDGRLRPLKDGFFSLALETGSAILPVALSGTFNHPPTHPPVHSEAHLPTHSF